MFPLLRERFGSALDLVVEFSTLGEYRLGADGALCPAGALTPAPEREPQMGGAGVPGPKQPARPAAQGTGSVARAAVRRIVAGGAAGLVPVATPAARRLAPASAVSCVGERPRPKARAVTRPPARRRKPVAPEQLCLAV